jgi:hypothetical protein
VIRGASLDRPNETLVLHSSVALRWWHLRLPHAEHAVLFLLTLSFFARDRGLRLVAPAGIEEQVSDELVKQLLAGGTDAAVVREAIDSVPLRFQQLVGEGALVLVRDDTLLVSPVMSTAIDCGIPFYDRLTVALAHKLDLPLLVADDAARQKLECVRVRFPEIQVVWLPDYL